MHSLARVAAERAALVVIDVQNDFCDPAGRQAIQGNDVSAMPGVIARLLPFIDRAREADVPVVFVRTTHDPTTDSPEWLGRHDDPERVQSCRTGEWGAEFHAVAPRPGEPVVVKHRYNAFAGTPLQSVLHGLGRRSLLFCGTTTNTCVETTLRDAVCRDFLVTLVEDCCGAYTADAQNRAIGSIREGFGLVTGSRSIIARWTGEDPASRGDPPHVPAG